ncbi:hypothetical protein P0082_02850 [Candidatus Haliotispira prima]|uniref:PD-(D/E)XK nuclease superfamily protein n=1 Tax=Candidatus Haliotispira prima TaxID=3034016 RepID=A0ABY8MIM2_9SPIO|nr:hypothetical protein P0082_02850 [Candidatus Haliotispira prima]
MRENIFEKLIKDEDTATEGLVNIISQFKKPRVIFCELVPGIDDINADTIETQIRQGNQKPDIIAKCGSTLLIIEVKVKTCTDLQDSQRDGYTDFYKEYRKNHSDITDKKLIYLIPKNYKHKRNLPKNSFIISWEDLLSKWETEGSVEGAPEGNIVLAAYCEKLREILESDMEVKLNKEDIPQFLSYSMNFWRLLAIVNTIKKKTIDGYKIELCNDENEYSIYISKDKKYILGFGIWYELGEKSEAGPLNLWFSDYKDWNSERTSQIKELLTNSPGRWHLEKREEDDWNSETIWVLTKDFYVADEDLISSAWGIIESIITETDEG